MRVHVVVPLLLRPDAGGHVKCWQRLAEAATRQSEVDLTVHFMGHGGGVEALAPNVRYRLHRPVFSTAWLPFLSHTPDATDLGPWHPGLARALAGAEVIHTTDAFFCFAKTALGVARRRGIPLVNSLHTDTPGYTRLYTALTVKRLLGDGWLARRLLAPPFSMAARAEAGQRRRLAAHQAVSRHALVSRPEERAAALAVLPEARVGTLRRGVDRGRFNPGRRDRARLAAEMGIPEDRPLVLFVGRVNDGKGVMVLARALAELKAKGQRFHLLCAGEGDRRDDITALLGEAASCPGPLPQDTVARLYADADLFVLPSAHEVLGNVVMEALAAGTPAVVNRDSGMDAWVRPGQTGAVAEGADPGHWAGVLAPLLADPARLQAMGRAAHADAEARLPTWDGVLAEDLVPRWRAALREGAR
ncbi:glycosyltransferase [Roseospirillum parvum]|uniref:Glycosyltransferase involved in cell wall bisynthesis n=1 Tax=Roseospirillum parvum TaxID=83401 RepID=A0A1G7W9Y9_9PROT|nr:glycosyltransferase [Roseospirillum parvum]SDG68774.1 Glycosyltransferase involved in cell wall bisynthesis [Roseospirillum parvum]